MKTNSVYKIVTDQIIKQLENGVVPWHKPWNAFNAVNWRTQKPYRGINAFLLEEGEYATFKQIKEAGGKVKKGEKSHIVVFWRWLEKEDKETKEIERIPLLRYYRVFEINTQCEGMESRRNVETFDHEPITECENIVHGFEGKPKILHEGSQACYIPALDQIKMPKQKYFEKIEEYYSVLFHEMIHATGHRSRLDRDEVRQVASFGSESYSKEELIAEMGAAMLCGIAGIEQKIIENSAAYIQSWLRVLKDDVKFVIQAASSAQRGADHILGISFD